VNEAKTVLLGSRRLGFDHPGSDWDWCTAEVRVGAKPLFYFDPLLPGILCPKGTVIHEDGNDHGYFESWFVELLDERYAAAGAALAADPVLKDNFILLRAQGDKRGAYMLVGIPVMQK